MDGSTDKPSVREVIAKIAKQNGFVIYNLKVTQKFDKGENYLGDIQRAILKGVKVNGEKKDLNIIIKTPPLNLSEKGIPVDKYYECEIFAYSEYFPRLLKLQDEANFPECSRIEFAKCLLSTTDIGKQVIVFEDLNALGFKLHDRLKALNKEHALILTKKLATLHALGYGLKQRLSKEDHERYKKQNTTKEELTPAFLKLIKDIGNRFLEYTDDEVCKLKLKQYCESETMFQDTYSYYDLDKNDEQLEYNTIIHSDVWSNNLLFKYENENVTDLILIDWQTIKYASPMIDLIFVLYVCIDEETRDSGWDEILDVYYDTYSSRLQDLKCDPERKFTKELLRKQLKNKLGLTMLIATLMLPFTLNNKEDSMEMSDFIDEDDQFDVSVVKFSDTFIKRFNGVLRHLVKTNVI